MCCSVMNTSVSDEEICSDQDLFASSPEPEGLNLPITPATQDFLDSQRDIFDDSPSDCYLTYYPVRIHLNVIKITLSNSGELIFYVNYIIKFQHCF